MNIYQKYHELHDQKITIDRKDLEELITQLGKFLYIYQKNVYIEKEEHFRTLEMLQNLYNKLANGQIADLLIDPSIIID